MLSSKTGFVDLAESITSDGIVSNCHSGSLLRQENRTYEIFHFLTSFSAVAKTAGGGGGVVRVCLGVPHVVQNLVSLGRTVWQWSQMRNGFRASNPKLFSSSCCWLESSLAVSCTVGRPQDSQKRLSAKSQVEHAVHIKEPGRFCASTSELSLLPSSSSSMLTSCKSASACSATKHG